MIGHELDAVGELLVGVAQRYDPDGIRGAAVFQVGFELLPGLRGDTDGEHLGMQEPALVVLLPSHLNPARHNRTLEARAVQTFAKHFAGARKVGDRQRAGREEFEVDRRDFMGPGVLGVGQGMELRNRARPIIAGANGTDRQPAAMVLAVALEERATDGGQARQQHMEVVIIQPLGLVPRLPPRPIRTGAATGGWDCERGGTDAGERLP